VDKEFFSVKNPRKKVVYVNSRAKGERVGRGEEGGRRGRELME
jgi:hypothetical protein